MSFKHLLRLSLAGLAIGYSVPAAPFLVIGDGAELFVTGNLGVRADDNIYLARDATSDLIFDLEPGAELAFGKNAQFKGKLALAEAFTSYSDNSALNTNLCAGDFVSRFDDGKLRLGYDLSFRELNQNSFYARPSLAGLAPGLVRRDNFATTASAEAEFSQKTAMAVSVGFTRDNYKQTGYADADNLTVPIDFFYKWTPKTDVSIGYRYRDTQVQIGQDSTEHFFNVGARGEFSPKLIGRFAVGLNRRTLGNGSEANQLGLEAKFAYELTPKTGLEFGASNDFGTSPQGQQLKNKTVNAQITTRFTPEWSVDCRLSWRAIDYGPRTDDYWEGQLGTVFVVSTNVRLVGAYYYRNYSSDVRLNEFRNNVFSVAANFRY
ncbi:MAG: outer membrane beta-barrel protein [Opitutaceae bacterium]